VKLQYNMNRFKKELLFQKCQKWIFPVHDVFFICKHYVHIYIHINVHIHIHIRHTRTDVEDFYTCQLIKVNNKTK